MTSPSVRRRPVPFCIHVLDVGGCEVHSAIKGCLVWTLPAREGLGRTIRCLPGRIVAALAAFCILTFVPAPGFALDGSTPNVSAKISPKSFTSAEQALHVGIDDLKAGDAASSVAALTYAAEGGQPIARWKLGEMYADGVDVARDDVKAYHYFNQLVEEYDEDAPDQRIPGSDLERLRRRRGLQPDRHSQQRCSRRPGAGARTLPVRGDHLRRSGRRV
jgi:hypothetical protein